MNKMHGFFFFNYYFFKKKLIVLEFSHGRMEENILDNIMKIKNKEKANFNGVMEENIKDIGIFNYSFNY